MAYFNEIEYKFTEKGLAEHDAKVREDAIEEFLKETGKYIYYMDKYTDFEGQMISIENLNLIAEQIKENMNE